MRAIPDDVVTALFPDGHEYGDPLNRAAFPHLLRTDWPVRNVQWALVLPDRAVLVRVDVGEVR